MKELVFDDVNLIYHSKEGETLALSQLSFDVEQGELVSVVGPSGCGKTTVLSLICGLVSPSSGKILLKGKELGLRNSSTGYMLQKDQLFSWRSILSNVLLGLEIQNKKNAKNIAIANELLDKYGLSDFKSHFPGQLSGGMRQRVALIRTLVLSPDILLLDEPFSALDFQTRLKVCDDVHGIIKQEKKTAIFVTHDISEAISISDRVIVLTPRPAKVKQIINLADIADLSPLERRESKLFSTHFEKIWRLLD